MTDPHLNIIENLAAYALGSLDLHEAAELRAHLQTCDTCPAELTAYQNLSTGLLAALAPQAPRASLRSALQKRLPGTTKSARKQITWSFGQVAFGIAFVLLVGLNIFSLLQVYTLKQQQAAFAGAYDSNQTAIAMLAYPSTQAIGFDQNGVTGSLLVDKKRNLLAVFAWHLPPPPAGRTYQMWLIDPQGDRTGGGFLMPESDEPFVMAIIQSPQSLAGFSGLGVTVEPLGGSPKPTGPKIFGVNF